MSPLRHINSPDLTAESPLVVLLLHGYGSNERDLPGIMPALGLELPWASLRAPIDMGGGAAWAPITTPGVPDPAPISAATTAVWAWVDAHLGADAQVLPIGFSQGGLMASQLLRTCPERVVKPVILGGFILGDAQPADEALAASKPPVFWGRGAEDQVITQAAIDRTSAWLPSHSTLTERVYPGLAHGINTDEIADVQAFLAS